MTKALSILGSTGSIGTQSLDVARKCGYSVEALTAFSDAKGLEEQIREFHPKTVALVSETAANALREKIVVAKPASGYWVEPIKAETNVDGSVTLSVTCCRTGLAVIFK